MPARRRRRRTTVRRKSARRQPRHTTEPLLTPETAKSIAGVILILLGAVLTLGLFGVGGVLGRALVIWSSQLVGVANWVVPLLLAWYGVMAILEERVPRHYVLGSLLVLISADALLHQLVKTDQLTAAMAGQFGGLVGYGLTSTIGAALGGIGSTLVFIALLIIGLFVTLNRSGGEPKPVAEETAREPEPEPPVRPGAAPPPPPPKPRPRSDLEREEFQPRVVDTAWEQPPLSLLSEQSSEATAGDTTHAQQIIEQTLANFNIQAAVENINVGPSVTQYELRPEPGVKLNQITNLSNDLALALAAHPIRIEAPIPGKSTVGIEVPNQKPAVVRLRHLFESKQWKRGGALPLALGLDVSGQPAVVDLATMPHLLIAGATGSGKSVGINGILMSLLFTHSPKHLRLLMVDPKRVELTMYNDIPHLLAPVIVEPNKVVNALKWVTSEMDRRYRLFQDERVKNLAEFNKQFPDQTLPQLVVVIDELADLMAISGKSIEAAIVRIAQLARATGIHLVIATQRPSVDVITGLIKANFPSRIAFTVTSGTDSRTILDTAGAEKLLGQGDMLFMSPSSSKPVRLQGAYVETREIKQLTDFLKGKGEPTYDEAVTESPQGGGLGGDGGEGGEDPLYEEAKAEVLRSRKASASLLQRRLKVGYARAARLLDELEANGVIGPGEGAKPREILVDPEND